MKKIIATDTEYGVLGDKKSVTLHYENNTSKTIKLPVDYNNKEDVRSYTSYIIHNFNLKN